MGPALLQVGVCAAALAVGAPSLARPPVATGDVVVSPLERLVDEGVRCYQELDYGCAIDQLQKALVDLQTGGRMEPATELRARLHLSFALLAVDRTEDARGQLRRVLGLNPRFTLDAAIVSPRIVAALEQVRRELVAPAIPSDLDAGDPVPLPTAPDLPDAMLRPVRVARAGAALDVREEPRWQVDLGGGIEILTGTDAEHYNLGPGLDVRFLWHVDELWVVGLGTTLHLHSVGDLDLGQGAPNSLWILGVQPQVGISAPLASWFSLEAMAVLGAVVYGHDGLDGGAGLETGLTVGARFRLTRTLSAALCVTPLVAIGSVDDATATSFSVPVSLLAGFAF